MEGEALGQGVLSPQEIPLQLQGLHFSFVRCRQDAAQAEILGSLGKALLPDLKNVCPIFILWALTASPGSEYGLRDSDSYCKV